MDRQLNRPEYTNLCCILKRHHDHNKLKEDQTDDEDDQEHFCDEEFPEEEEEYQVKTENKTLNKEEKSSDSPQEEPDIEKKLISKGVKNTRPTPGDLVTCHYVSKRQDGSQLDNTYERKVPYSFTFGVEKTEAVSTMDTGEISFFHVPWQKLYGVQGLPGNLPQCSDLTFKIHLLNVHPSSAYKEN